MNGNRSVRVPQRERVCSYTQLRLTFNSAATASTPEPDGAWMSQMSRNLTDLGDGFLTGKRFFIHDRDPRSPWPSARRSPPRTCRPSVCRPGRRISTASPNVRADRPLGMPRPAASAEPAAPRADPRRLREPLQGAPATSSAVALATGGRTAGYDDVGIP